MQARKTHTAFMWDFFKSTSYAHACAHTHTQSLWAAYVIKDKDRTECTLMPASGEKQEGTGEGRTGNLNFHSDVLQILSERKKKNKPKNLRQK